MTILRTYHPSSGGVLCGVCLAGGSFLTSIFLALELDSTVWLGMAVLLPIASALVLGNLLHGYRFTFDGGNRVVSVERCILWFVRRRCDLFSFDDVAELRWTEDPEGDGCLRMAFQNRTTYPVTMSRSRARQIQRLVAT